MFLLMQVFRSLTNPYMIFHEIKAFLEGVETLFLVTKRVFVFWETNQKNKEVHVTN